MAKKRPPKVRPPKGKYHVDGLRILRTLIGDYESLLPEDRRLGVRSFLDQVEIAGVCHIPHNHEEWRKTIRAGAKVFNVSDDDTVKNALERLIAGGHARKKREETNPSAPAEPTANEIAAHQQRVAQRHEGDPTEPGTPAFEAAARRAGDLPPDAEIPRGKDDDTIAPTTPGGPHPHMQGPRIS
ncbi:hypothetical protein HY414_01005 [Candidatus Kaiserbacteria bacterium]|nr:hypothetical protein [Candidatus Kaiserbacteria bacterium]